MSLEQITLIFSPFLLITSIVLLPISGTTPAFLFIPLVVAISFLCQTNNSKYIFKFLVLVFFIDLSLFILSVPLLFYEISLPYEWEIPRIDYSMYASPLRVTFFQQILYLSMGIIFAGVFCSFDKKVSLSILSNAAFFLALYGLLEFFIFMVTGQNPDFLSNRSFDGNKISSETQSLVISGVRLFRVKSLTGEASMFVYSLAPILPIMFYLRQKFRFLVVLISLILTISGTFLIFIFSLIFSLFILFLINVARFGVSVKNLNFAFVICVLALVSIISFFALNDVAFFMIEKFSGASNSGQTRSDHFVSSFLYWESLPLSVKLGGVGYGSVRPTNMFCFLLLNAGLLGLISYILFFLWPLFFLKLDTLGGCLLVSVFASLAMSFASVPEISYLTPWLIIGIVYRLVFFNPEDSKKYSVC